MMHLNSKLDIESLFQSYNELETLLTKTQKKYIHYNSIKNFIYHYQALPASYKEKVIYLLWEYLEVIKEHEFNFDAKSSFDVTTDYLNNLADIYIATLNFSGKLKLGFVLYWGILADILLLVLGLLSKLYYVPIITLLLFIYFLYVKIFKERKHLAYGIFY